MSSVYYGKYRDLFLSIELEESVFVKCETTKECVAVRVQMNTYSKQYKRKFTSKRLGSNLKITRVL